LFVVVPVLLQQWLANSCQLLPLIMLVVFYQLSGAVLQFPTLQVSCL
jgi:hypothetical protein